MSSLKSELDAIESEIAHVDAQIAQWEAKKLELKRIEAELRRRRNGAVPISQIPPEVIAKIFSYSVTRLASKSLADLPLETRADSRDLIDVEAIKAEKAATRDALFRPSVLTLIHVCHGWRSLACALPELWSHMQVHLRTAPDLVALLWKHAGASFIQLAVTCDPEDLQRHHSDIPTLSIMCSMLVKVLNRLKSVEIYCHSGVIFRAMENSADHLESLIAVEHSQQGLFVRNELLRGNAPNLRRLDLTRIAIPWTSPLIFSKPHLTHLALDKNPMPTTPDSIAALLSFLRNARSIKSLQLYVGYSEVDEGEEFFLSSTTDKSPISLQSLVALELNCSCLGAMAAISGLLRISKDIEKLIVTTSNLNDDIAEMILAFAKCGRSPEEFIEPEEVELGLLYRARCWRKPRFQQCNKSAGFAAGTVDEESHTVWQEITVSYPMGGMVANPTVFRTPWSFANLRAITVSCNGVPAGFWQQLSSLRFLEFVRIFGLQQQTFVNALGDSSSVLGAMGNGLHGGMSQTAPSRPLLFPALRALAFSRFHWDIRATAYVQGITIDEATNRFLNALNDAMITWGGSMKELSFASCEDIVPATEFVDRLLSRVDRFVWEKRVYFRISDDGGSSRA